MVIDLQSHGAVERRPDDGELLGGQLGGVEVGQRVDDRCEHRGLCGDGRTAWRGLVAGQNVYGYGPVSGPLTEALPLGATTRKGRVRAQMWRDLADAHQAGRLRVVAGRASDFFGPGVIASAVGDRFFTPICRGARVDVVGDPDRLHTYTYVPDFGEALVRLSETPATWGSAWHIPNATTGTTREFAATAAGLAAAQLRLRPVRAWQLRLIGTVVPPIRETVEMLYEFDEDHVVDHTAYAAVLGDHATPLDDAVAATVAAYTAPRCGAQR